MRELRFTSWRDFQNLCRFWIQDLVLRGTGQSVEYAVYGNDGEGQGGVDLVPQVPAFDVVGQSKCWNSKVLNWGSIEEELKKTSEFPGAIRFYVILTTASRHTSVQQRMPDDVCTYVRRQGSFQVRIYYWDELQNLDFIPQRELRRVFPRLYSLAASTVPSGPSLADYTQSLSHSRSFLPTAIPPEYVEWLSRWDYTQGYVPAQYFDLFHSLCIEIDRMRNAVARSDLREWLNEGNRLQLAMCLPAATALFQAIQDFAQAVVRETVSEMMRDGSLVYAHGHDDPAAASRITFNWKLCAEALVHAYRSVVEGASSS